MIALREIAEKTLPPNDLRERLINSMQQNVEMDEPEAAAAPMLPQAMRVTLGRDHQSEDLTIDMINEDALLRAMKSLVPGGAHQPESRPCGRSAARSLSLMCAVNSEE